MTETKWFADLSGRVPVAEAARHVLVSRLQLVLDRMPDAIHHSAVDTEHVHQLRVSTRRAGAAARIFAGCLPANASKTLQRTLRRIRRAAGDARDWDVFTEMISMRYGRAAATHKPGLDFLLGHGQARRLRAQSHLEKLGTLASDKMPLLVHNILNQLIDDTGVASFRAQAVPILTGLLHEWEAAARLDLNDYENLHRVRILGKQFRYAMEVFASCFEPPFREELYPAIERMQDILGLANDSHVAVGRLQEIRDYLEATQSKAWPRFEPGIGGLIRYHQRRLPEQRKRFASWWREWIESGLERRFERMLR